MTPKEGVFSCKLPFKGSNFVALGDGTYFPNRNVGQVCLSTLTSPLTLNNVLHVPVLKYNLLSAQKLCNDNNYEVGFDSSFSHVKDKAMGENSIPMLVESTPSPPVILFLPL